MKKQLLLVISSMFVLAGCGPSVSESSSTDPSVEPSESSSSSTGVSSDDASSSSSSSSSSSGQSSSSSSGGEEATGFDSIKEKIATAIANKDKVASGTVSKDEYGTPVTINYEFGTDKNGVFYHEHQDVANPTDWNYPDKYFGKDSSGVVYGIQKSGLGNLSNITSPKATDLSINGYALSYNYSTYYYGVEGIASFVLGIASENANQDLTFSSTEEGYEINVGLFEQGDYSSSFVVFDAKIKADEIIESMEFSYSKYYSSDFTKDPETGVIYLNDDASATPTVVTFAQTAGARTATNPIDIDSMCATSFDLIGTTGYGDSAKTTTITDTITIEKGVSLSLSAANVLPETANMAIDTISAVCESSDVTISSFGSNTSISAKEAGTYTIVAKTRKVTKTFTLIATLPKATSFSITAFARNSDEVAEHYATYSSSYFYSDEQDSITVCSGKDIYLTGGLTPYTSDQSYEMTSTDLALDAVEEFKINDYADPKTAYHFVAPAVGTYSVTFISAINDISSTVAVNVVEPDLASIFSKEYISDSIIAKFTANDSDPKTGSVTIDPGSGTKTTYSYSYDKTTSIVSVIDDAGNVSTQYKFALDSYGALYCYQASSEFFSECKEYTIAYRMKGEWYGSTDAYNISFGIYSTSCNLSITKKEGFESVVYINFTLEVVESDDCYILNMNDQKTADWDTPKPLGTYLTEGQNVTIDKDITKISFPLTADGTSTVVELVKESNPRG